MKTDCPSRAAIWIRALRVPYFTGAAMAVVCAAAAAFYVQGGIRVPFFLAALVGAVSIHAASNIINDYFDYRSGCDAHNRVRGPLNGGSRVITDGLLSPAAMLNGALVTYGIGIACGLYLVFGLGRSGWVLLLYGLAGLFISYGYTAPWPYLAGRGLGEIGLGLAIGVIPVMATYFVLTRSSSWTAFLGGLPVSGLMAAVLWINEFPDAESDLAMKKRNAVVRLGRKRARYVFYTLLAVIYLSPVTGVAAGVLPAWALLSLAAVPFALRAAITLHRHYGEPERLVPAQVAMVRLHFVTGLLMTLGLLLGRRAG
jgi:1,4-dihydroxy-2-naphthoate octaprenyltransferase